MTQRVYHTLNYPGFTPGGKTLLTGIRGVNSEPCKVYISGWYQFPEPLTRIDAFVYKGTLRGLGTWNILSYPSAPGRTVTATNLYGPDNYKCDEIRVVGNYTTEEEESGAFGALYEGKLDGSGEWVTLIPSTLTSDPIIFTIAHSTNGGLVVGNYDTQLDQGKGFIYDIQTKKYTAIEKKGAKSITAYGIWHDGGDHYTICGGYTALIPIISGLDSGYLVDYDRKKHRFSNWRLYSFDNNPAKSIVTHFDGITTDGCGGYNLTGDYIGVNEGPELAFFANVKRNHHGRFKKLAEWEHVTYPNSVTTSGNTVYEKSVLGVYTLEGDDSVYGYVSNEK